jgi:hypothetical protein
MEFPDFQIHGDNIGHMHSSAVSGKFFDEISETQSIHAVARFFYSSCRFRHDRLPPEKTLTADLIPPS